MMPRRRSVWAAARKASLISSGPTVGSKHRCQVRDRAVGHRHPQDLAVETPLHRLEHEARRTGGPGGRRDDVDRGGAGPAQIVTSEVEHRLVVGVGVDRRHEALAEAEGVVEHLHHRHEAVGRARGGRDDEVARRVESVVVHADDEGGVGLLAGRRDDHALGTALDVAAGGLTAGEASRRLDDDLDASLAPGDAPWGPFPRRP